MNKTNQPQQPNQPRLSGTKLMLITAYIYTLWAFDIPIMAGYTLTVIVFAFVVVVHTNAVEAANSAAQKILDQVLNETQTVINEIQKQLDKEKGK